MVGRRVSGMILISYLTFTSLGQANMHCGTSRRARSMVGRWISIILHVLKWLVGSDGR